MIIRRALQAEADVLTKIALASKSYWGYSPAQIEAWRDEITFTAQCIERHATFVAEVANKVVAVAQLNSTTQPSSLDALWVHPDFIGCGI